MAEQTSFSSVTSFVSGAEWGGDDSHHHAASHFASKSDKGEPPRPMLWLTDDAGSEPTVWINRSAATQKPGA